MPIRSTALMACAGLLAQVQLAAAQDPARQADEDACRPDVFRLCISAIPDEAAIVACLDAKLSRLSPACHAVMAPAKPTATRRRRTAQP